jgi:hypothetical protein
VPYKPDTYKPNPSKPASNKITLTPITPVKPTMPVVSSEQAETMKIASPVTSHTLIQATTSSYVSDGLIHKIRLGDHSDKTRIVFELEEKTPYSVSTNPSNKTMTINFPSAQYSANAGSRARLSDRVKEINQSKAGNGESFTFQLSKAPKATKDFSMNPDRDVSRQRVVVDLIY